MRFLCVAVLLMTTYAMWAELLPQTPDTFTTVPGKALRLKFKGTPSSEHPVAELRDFTEKKLGDIPLTAGKGEFIFEYSAGLPSGFYTIHLEGKKFGLLVQDHFDGEPDRFFGIDSFLSWNNVTLSERYEALKMLRRYGIASARDRFQWTVIQKDQRVYNFRNEYDEIRRLYPRTGVELLDVHHGSPDWSRKDIPRFPEALHAATTFWMTLGANWRPYWNSVENWNEPEGGFGGNLPADQMMPGSKAMRYGLWASAPEIRLGGCGFTGISPEGNYHRTAARNGLLENVDFISFHTYGTAADMLEQTRQYRDYLKSYGKEGMPLHLTEISRVAWNNFSTAEETERIATEIAMQAAVGRAIGLEKIYFFALYDLKEGNKTFGFLDENRTPRASFAAFIQSVRRLSHVRYLGALKSESKEIKSGRVYRGENRDIVVLETAESGGVFRPGFAVIRVEGLDGRELSVDTGAIVLEDPIVYLECESLPDSLIDTETEEYALLTRAGLPAPERTAPSPVVLFPHPDFSAIARYSSNGGYYVEAGTPLPVALDLFNLSGKEERVTLTVETGLALVAGDAKSEIIIPAYGKKRAEFKVVLSEAQEATGKIYDLDFKLAFTDPAQKEQAALAIRGLGAVEQLEVSEKGSEKISFGGLENYTIRIKDQPWNDRNDLDASFQLRYTKDALQLIVDVIDDRHHADSKPSDMWKGDSIQVGIQPGTPKTIAERAKFLEFTAALTPDGPKVWRGGVRPVPIEITRTETLTRYVITLPASELGIAGFQRGDRMRMSLVVNDNDGAGRKGFLHWGNGLGVNKNPEEFNRVILK